MEKLEVSLSQIIEDKKLSLHYNFLLELDEEGNVPNIQADELLKLPNNSKLKLQIFNGSKISKNAKLITNAYNNTLTLDMILPSNIEMLEKIEKIDPDHFDDCISFILELNKSGPIFILFTYEDNISGKIKFTKEVFIIVEPLIEIGNKRINLDSIQQQTVLSKSLGKVDDWEKYFKEAHSLNYNFVHFTPIQKLGKSESLYCIRDNNCINDVFFNSGNLKNEEKLKIINSKISEFRELYNIGSMVDIVLNHAATNSDWLYKNPQSGFNLINSPHLTCSYELDKILLNYSYRFADKKVSAKCAPNINSETDLNELMNEISKEIYKNNLEEFFLIGIEKYFDEFKIFFHNYKKNFKDYLIKKNYLIGLIFKNGVNIDHSKKDLEKQIYDLIFESCMKYGASRYGVEINIEFISVLILNLTGDNINEANFLKEVKKNLNKINDFWNNKSKEFISKAIENIRSYVKYEFLDLKRFKVTYDKLITENYFTVFDENNNDSIYANNGWLFGVNDPTVNFAKYGNWYYFTRSIVIWGDCPKLNYGEKREDSVYLWDHMTTYVQDMAKIFNGFRLDNAHSTPIHVAEYLMRKAREVNPNLVVIAELFAGSKEREINFVNRIGINHLIREAIYCNDPQNLSEKIHKYGGGFENVLGKLDKSINEYKQNKLNNNINSVDYLHLVPSTPRSIIYDLTHDNPTFYEKYNHLGLNLSFMAIISMAQSSIGSTRGYDQLFPYQPSVVKENRTYEYDKEFLEIITNEEKGRKNNNNNNKVEHIFEFNLKNQKQIKTQNVRLALSSNNWNPDIVLSEINDNLFSIKLMLNMGEVYYFKYVIDNNVWMHDNTKESVKDNTGNVNNILDLREDYKFNLTDLKMVRREINEIRNDLNNSTENQFFLHRDRDLICIFRMFSQKGIYKDKDYDGYAMICRCGYELDKSSLMSSRVELPGEIFQFICSSTIHIPKFDVNIIRSDLHLIGVKSNLQFSRDIKFLHSIAKVTNVNGKDIIDFHSLLPNTILLMKIKHSSKVKESMQALNKNINFINESGNELIINFDMCDLNAALFKCESEELENTFKKRGNYEIKNYGKFVYAGITHLHQLVQKLKISQELNHPMFNNIREGDWLIEYNLNRINDAKSLSDLCLYFKENIVNNYKNIIIYLKPYYFCLIIDALYNLIFKRILTQYSSQSICKKEIVNGEFTQNLLIAVLQFTGYVQSAMFKSGDKLSLAAGLPHFSIEYMRCWGRDTFISFKGLLLIPGHFAVAKQIIKNFASTMRHGLIPNLLDSGNKPRYNARDSVWFFLQAIKDYITFTSDFAFLKEEIDLIFLDDDMNTHYSKLNKGEKKKLRVNEIIHHILESHARGIQFREWRSGKEIDEHMKDEGFLINIFMDKKTGFIYGGNGSNCGTWMDKMGSSDKAKNRGVPATPRDGADVEIIGILYSILNFVNQLNSTKEEFFPFKNIKLKDNSSFTYYEWSLLIKDNFESLFFISSLNNEASINKKNIYKDYISHPNTYAPNKYCNLQLRPNFLITMAISPDLFTKEKALKALAQAEKYLLVPNGMGVRTLDPEDKNYNGNYDNTDDTNNCNTAHGFNYHNGPEWLWPIGFYLIAKINFNTYENKNDLKSYVYSILTPHAKYIKEDNWKGLPELMNKNNTICPGSCNTQAWSIATVLESLYELNNYFI